MPKTVKIIPSWKSIIDLMLMVIESPDVEEKNKEPLRVEIRRLAEIVDEINMENEK